MVNLTPSWPTRDRVLALVRQRDFIEDEMKIQYRILEANDVGATEPLVDEHGVPRVGINVGQVTEARTKLNSLEAELAEIVAKIDKELVHVVTADLDDVTIPGIEFPPVDENQAFATITGVLPGSQADVTGIKAGDELLQFGWLNHQTFCDTSQVDYIARYYGGRLLTVRLRRAHEVHKLQIVPEYYPQVEMLGCSIKPLYSYLYRQIKMIWKLKLM